jgi:class 3 adenylate cyclase/tetratricopeptide (TPR) repeat protein
VSGAPPAPTATAPEAHADSLERYIPREFLSKLEAARANRSMEGERRVLTVLFCDVKGSTSMAEMLDPEEWAEIMNEAFESLISPVYKYEGTLARLMGDAILAFFGAPIAHEDDPQRAVLAGLSIIEQIGPFREKMKRERGLDFDVRVGINTGLVVVGAVGSDLRMEYTAMGDAVNLASRMEQLAEPGTLLISGNTYKQVSSLFEFKALGPVEVRGKAEAVDTYQVLGERKGAVPTRGIEGLSSPLVGRERELATLQERISDLLTGQGQIVSLMGEAGLGKSRLMAELRKSMANDADGKPKIRWCEGRSLSYETSTPYAPFVDLLSDCFGFGLDDTDEAKYGKIRGMLDELSPGAAGQMAPFIASLLGITPPGDDLEKIKYLDPPYLRGGIFQTVVGLVQMLASREPLVLVFEDLHWTDPTSLELLEQLIPLTESAMLMIVAMFRPQRQEPSWHFHELASRDCAHRYTSIMLEPLDEEHARTLVANLLEIEDLPERVRALILQKAEGNPFYVEEVIRSLLDARLVIREGDHWRATQEIEKIAVPDTLAGVITARLDRLDEESRRVAQTASVVGREFAYDVLGEIYEAPAAIDASLSTLQRRELVREKSRIPTRAYLFKHVLTQETAYSSILLSKRRELHRRVAECLERVAPDHVHDIARHFGEAREEERALPYIVDAGDQAAHAYASKEAMGYYNQALDILERVENVQLARRAYEGLGSTLMLINDLPGSIGAYEKMLRYAEEHQDISMSVSAHNKLSRVTMVTGQVEELENHLVDAERLAKESNDLPGLVEFYTIQCAVCSGSGDFDTGAKYLGDAVKAGLAMNHDQTKIFGLTHTSNFQTYMVKFDEAWKTSQEALKFAEEIGDKMHMGELLSYAHMYHYLMEGNLDEAERVAQQGLEIADHIGYSATQWQANYSLGIIANLRGEHEKAVELLERSHVFGQISYPFFDAMTLGTLCKAYVDINPKLAEKAMPYEGMLLGLLAHPPFAGWAGGTTWVDLGFYELERGNVEQAGQYFDKGLTTPSTEWLIHRPRYLVGGALVALRQGNLGEAARLAQEAKEYAEEHKMRFVYPMIALAQAQVSLARDDIDGALAGFAKAEALGQEMKLRPVVLQARLGTAEALATCGRLKEANAKRQEAEAAVNEMAGLFKDEQLRVMFVESAMGKMVK